MDKKDRVKTDRQRSFEWMDKIKLECEGMTPEQKTEVLLFSKYSAWKAIETRFDEDL